MPSIVWEYFDEFEGGGKCRLCGCVRNRKDKSTSTFWQHLERVHGLDKQQMMMGGGRFGGKTSGRSHFSNSQGNFAGGKDNNGMDTMCGDGESGPPAEKIPKLDLVNSLGLDQKATEETFRYISELIKQQQQQLNNISTAPQMSSAMPELEPAIDLKRDETTTTPLEKTVEPPIGINKRNELASQFGNRVEDGITTPPAFFFNAMSEESNRKGGAKRKNKFVELPPTPPPSQLSNFVMQNALSTAHSSASTSSTSSSSLLNNYFSGILQFAHSPLNLASITSSLNTSPTPPSFASPVQQPNSSQMLPSASGHHTDQPQHQQNGLLLTVPKNPPSLLVTDVENAIVPNGAEQTTTDLANKKRSDYLSWDEFFMGVALMAAQRSKDPITQVGACIVKENSIVGIGYNGMPLGCNDDEMPWGKDDANPLNNKYLYVCHAEMNAILNKNSASIDGATLYTTLFPCSECAKIIIQSRISRVVYLNDKKTVQMEASRRLFNITGIKFSHYECSRPELTLRFK